MLPRDRRMWDDYLEATRRNLEALAGYHPVVLVCAPVVARTDDATAVDMDRPVLLAPAPLPNLVLARLLRRASRNAQHGRITWEEK